MALAADAFQACRLGDGRWIAPTRLVLAQVRSQRSLVVAVAEADLGSAAPDKREEVGGHVAVVVRPNLDDFTAERLWLLQFVETAAIQLESLWLDGALEAMASLGYAVHNLPALVASPPDEFDRNHFGFNFRIAAYHWSKYSLETQEVLAEAVGLSPRQVEEWIGRDGFVINWFPTVLREPLGWDDVKLYEDVDLKAPPSGRNRARLVFQRRRRPRR